MLATRIAFVVICIAVVGWATFTMLLPRLTNPPVVHVLLNTTEYLTSESYEKQFSLELLRSDRINVKVSGNGKIFDLWIAKMYSPETLVDQRDIASYDNVLTIPVDGNYSLRVSTYVGEVRVTVLVTKL